MAYCIMNVDKQNRAAVYGLQIEANRDKEKEREFDNSDIDRERTDQNYYLKECKSWNREITKQIKAAGVKERANSVVMITGVYTASPDWFETHTREQMEQYFKDCMEFHIREYCQGKEERLLNAVVHLDESTPHLQIASSCLVSDERGDHLSAKIIMGNRQTYRLRQDRFYDEVGKKHEMERGERRDPTQTKEHTTKREWQIATQEARLEEAKEKLEVYDKISAAAGTKNKPTIEIEKSEVKDGLLRSHEEIYIKVPCKDEKEALNVKKEIVALYDKDFAKESLNELLNAKSEDLKKKRKDLAKKQREFTKNKNTQLKEIEAARSEALRESRVYQELTLEKMGLSDKVIERLAKEKITETLVSDTVRATINMLDKGQYFKEKPSALVELTITNTIIRALGDIVHQFVDRIKENIIERLSRTKNMSREFDEDLVR